jgi:hypothetical protein
MADIRLLKEESAFTRWLVALKAKAVIKKEQSVFKKQIKSGNTDERKQ